MRSIATRARFAVAAAGLIRAGAGAFASAVAGRRHYIGIVRAPRIVHSQARTAAETKGACAWRKRVATDRSHFSSASKWSCVVFVVGAARRFVVACADV